MTTIKPTVSMFIAGSVGGVALDILSLYFLGFPAVEPTVLSYTGAVIRVLLFMALTGFLACLYSNGQVRNAFVIGIAAPSILLNLAATVQKPSKDVLPTLGVPLNLPAPAPAPSPKPTGFLPGLGIGVAEASEVWLAQPARPAVPSHTSSSTGRATTTAPFAQLSLQLGNGRDDALIKDSELAIYDAVTRAPVARGVPAGPTFALMLRPGRYVAVLTGRALEPTQVTLDLHPGENHAQLAVTPKQTTGWGTIENFKQGAFSNERFEKIQQLKR